MEISLTKSVLTQKHDFEHKTEHLCRLAQCLVLKQFSRFSRGGIANKQDARTPPARTYVCTNSTRNWKTESRFALRAFYPHNAAKEGKNVVQSRVFVVVVVVVRRRRIVGEDGTIAIASTGSSSGCGIDAHAVEPPGGGGADDGGSKTAGRTSNGGSSVRDWWCRLERWDR